ncbi:hypothetical protein VHEMI01336 [[Torrubiella] hemipterigena]|uniref:Uncharacterized protein n=1 Tax=[Torrubiella] hemipterigena TaxID=1531966 RepID=A0A0A1T4I1_9HYPO|nr:hypothetical protein VHEMI01336 [[Torrubiella] hemipterigena]
MVRPLLLLFSQASLLLSLQPKLPTLLFFRCLPFFKLLRSVIVVISLKSIQIQPLPFADQSDSLPSTVFSLLLLPLLLLLRRLVWR